MRKKGRCWPYLGRTNYTGQAIMIDIGTVSYNSDLMTMALCIDLYIHVCIYRMCICIMTAAATAAAAKLLPN